MKNTDMIKATINVKAAQRTEEGEDKLSMTCVGCFEPTKNGWKIEYTEIDEDMTQTLVTVEINSDTVQVIRNRGHICSVLVVEKDKRHECVYETEYGTLMLGIFGRKAVHSITKEGGFMKLVYAVDINCSYTSENEISLRIKAKEEV